MSLGDPITFAWNATTVTLNRSDDGNHGSEYYGVLGDRRFTLTVKHTIPSSRGASGESHLVRLDVEVYDAAGVLLRTASAWTVIRTDNGIQDPEESEDAAEAVVDFLSDANITKIVGRQI